MGRLARKRKRKAIREQHEAEWKMEIPEAMRIIHSKDPDPLELIKASKAISEAPHEVSFDDLIRCLTHGGVAAEMAARALNLVLERRTEITITSDDLITEEDYWIRYRDAAHRRSEQGHMHGDPN